MNEIQPYRPVVYRVTDTNEVTDQDGGQIPVSVDERSTPIRLTDNGNVVDRFGRLVLRAPTRCNRCDELSMHDTSTAWADSAECRNLSCGFKWEYRLGD